MKNQIETVSPLLMAANVFTLASLIVAQPVLDILGKSPEFFVANHLRNADVYLMILGLTAIIPAILLLPVFISTVLGKKVRSYVQTAVVFLLAALLFIRVLNAGPTLPSAVILVLALLLAGGFAALYLFNPKLSTTLAWLTPVVVLFPILFLTGANVQEFLGGATSANRPEAKQGADAMASRPPIVMVVWDELPTVDLLDANGNIDAKRFPHFSALASESTWYENATTVWITTLGALPAILTGSHPTARLPRYDSYPNNLFSLLEDQYELNVFESITQLRRPSEDEPGQAENTDRRLKRLQTLAEDVALIVAHLHLPPSYTEKLPSIEGQWGGFVSREGLEPKDLGKMSREEREAYLARMSDEERAAFNEEFAASMTEEERTAFVAAMTDEERSALAKSLSVKNPKAVADEMRKNRVEARQRIARHFNESRKDFFEKFIGSIQDYPRDTLHFVHVALPHPPSIYLPSGRVHTPPDQYQYPAMKNGEHEPVWATSQDELNFEHHRLRLQLGFADRLLGRLMAELERLEIYDESLIVVCADHGGSFLAGEPRRFPTSKVFGDVAFVPLFIKYPNQKEAARNKENVELIDVLPTITDVLNIELDWEFDGRSLIDPQAQVRSTKRLPPEHNEPVQTEFSEAEYMAARRDAHQRIINTFSLDDPRSDIFHYGKGLEYVGKEYSAIEAKAVPGTVTSPDIDRLSSIDPTSDNLYSSVRGVVAYSGSPTADLHVTVLVNERVSVITPVFDSGPELRFATIVPESAFTQGANSVRLVLLDLQQDS